MKTHLLLTLIVLMLLSGCGTFEVSVQQTEAAGPASPPATLAPTAVPSTTQPEGRPVLVAYVQDGNIHLFDEAAKETRTVFASGDVVRVTMSPDGQVIAFLRHSLFQQPELWEKISLWAVNRDGSNP